MQEDRDSGESNDLIVARQRTVKPIISHMQDIAAASGHRAAVGNVQVAVIGCPIPLLKASSAC